MTIEPTDILPKHLSCATPYARSSDTLWMNISDKGAGVRPSGQSVVRYNLYHWTSGIGTIYNAIHMMVQTLIYYTAIAFYQ